MGRAGPVLVLLVGGCATDDGQLPGGLPVQVAESGPQVCALPMDRAATGPFEARRMAVPQPFPRWTWATGITAADLDGDGLLDVLTPIQQGLELYETTPGRVFTSRGRELFADLDLSYASGTSVADYDGDGDLDIYVMRIVGDPAPEGGTLGQNRLLRNDGGQFVDVTATAGVAACGPHHVTKIISCFRTMTSSWGDYDQDGDLDLYVGNYGFVDESDGSTQDRFEPAEPDFLYRNEGDGRFTDISSQLPPEVHDGYTYAGGFFDLDDDGDLDLYTVNDFGTNFPNRVMWNEGGALVFDPDDPSGLVHQGTGMGLGIGDFNGDGVMDLAIPEWGGNFLYESFAGSRAWGRQSDDHGFVLDEARGQKVGWGTEAGDVDNDGDLDLVSQYGHIESSNSLWSNPTAQPDALYLNTSSPDGSFTFTDVGQLWGIDNPTQTRGAVLADLDRDGWLDLGKRSLNDDNLLYLSRCGAEGWLEVKLEQPATMNRDAVGARVEVEVAGRTQVRWIVAGGTGFASSPAPEAHFGLGPADVVDRLTVVWPDGGWSELHDVTTRQVLTISRVP